MDMKKALDIIAAGLFGIENLIIKIFLYATGLALGIELGKLIYILIFVCAVFSLGEVVSVLFHNYTLMYFLVATMARKATEPNVFQWIGVEIVGGALFIAGILCIIKILGALAVENAETA